MDPKKFKPVEQQALDSGYPNLLSYTKPEDVKKRIGEGPEVRCFMQHLMCGKCYTGHMQSSGRAMSGSFMVTRHVCNICGFVEDIKDLRFPKPGRDV